MANHQKRVCNLLISFFSKYNKHLMKNNTLILKDVVENFFFIWIFFIFRIKFWTYVDLDLKFHHLNLQYFLLKHFSFL